MKKDLRYLQSLLMVNFLPLIPFMRNQYVIYSFWAVSLVLIFIHLSYYVLRAAKAGLVFNTDKTPENRLAFQHFAYKFSIMFFSYIVAGWMVYIGFKYTGAV